MATKQLVNLAVCGLHLRNQPLNHQLTELGGQFVRVAKSTPNYRFFAIPGQNGKPTKPGMVRTNDGSGNAIHLEIWALEVEQLGRFVTQVPPPLAIGTVSLEGGDQCLGFIAEGWVAGSEENEDITHLGSWLEYLKSKSDLTTVCDAC